MAYGSSFVVRVSLLLAHRDQPTYGPFTNHFDDVSQNGAFAPCVVSRHHGVGLALCHLCVPSLGVQRPVDVWAVPEPLR